jgi:transposase
VAAVEEGRFPIPEIARIFKVGITFVKKMLKLHRAGEPLGPRPGGGPVPLLQEKEAALLRQAIRTSPDATLEELHQVLADKCQATASLSTIARRLQLRDLPRKKKSYRQGAGRNGPQKVSDTHERAREEQLHLY